MNIQDLIQEGYRVYPLSKTIGSTNIDYWRDKLLKNYSLYSKVDEENDILYVKYKFN